MLPYPAPKTAHRATQVRVCFFSPERAYPSPFRGRGGVPSVFGLLGLPCSFKTGPQWPNRAGLGLPWCRFPTLSPKPHTGPHGGEFGFGPLAGVCQEDCPPFRQSRVKNRAEEKTPLPCFSKIEPVKFVIPCKRFSKPPGENPFSLFMRRRFCAATGGPPGRMLHGIFAHKQRTRPFHGRVLVYHLILWRDGSPSPARSNLYATASWMGRIVYRSTPFCTLPSLPWTVVFSVSMSLFSSNR